MQPHLARCPLNPAASYPDLMPSRWTLGWRPRPLRALASNSIWNLPIGAHATYVPRGTAARHDLTHVPTAIGDYDVTCPAGAPSPAHNTVGWSHHVYWNSIWLHHHQLQWSSQYCDTEGHPVRAHAPYPRAPGGNNGGCADATCGPWHGQPFARCVAGGPALEGAAWTPPARANAAKTQWAG